MTNLQKTLDGMDDALDIILTSQVVEQAVLAHEFKYSFRSPQTNRVVAETRGLISVYRKEFLRKLDTLKSYIKDQLPDEVA